MSESQQCPKCNTATMEEKSAGISQCVACNTRVAFGELMPRVVVQPHTDKRFVVMTITDQNVNGGNGEPPPTDPVQIVIDRPLAKMIAQALFSVSRP